ncbi:LEA type 2 family protein [Accumulibacter sp.]|uniref:LEA type 2 family protein n=1 Tax=Accumulibacter sp. TaxID=2053492 RepID=UPI0025D295D2|nr:LEA type 2 family protein [Accumulibacter sp.]MCM8596951.1 LEA type 2 family protein [Accumulibacter sp.]MCM8624445.1 LEA type 2 family protein [Accumulibacter sp.]MDS4051100.1 LEA type 2 family protein [Accumulibacter sp.]
MKRFLIVLCLVALGGCAGLGSLARKPEVSIAGLSLVQARLFEQRFALRLRISNPNDVDLPVNGLSFEVEINGQPFITGLSDKPVTVPRFGEAILEVMATSTAGSALKQLRELQKGGRIDYRISGRLQLSGIGALPFERRGDLQLPATDGAPRKSPQSGAGSV